MLASEQTLVLGSFGVTLTHNFQQVLKCVGVEQGVSTLPEDPGQMSEEGLEDLFDIVFLASVDQEEDGFTSAESIRPQIHLQCVLKLRLSHIKQI